MAESKFKHPHLFLVGTSKKELYITPKTGRNTLKLPERNREVHFKFLKDQLSQLQEQIDLDNEKLIEAGISTITGNTIIVRGEPDHDLKYESFDLKKPGIELLSVHKTEEDSRIIVSATVHIPNGQLKTLIKKVNQYGKEDTDTGKPKNQSLIESISSIGISKPIDLWTDSEELFPKNGEEIWWELWLRVDQNKQEIIKAFKKHALEIQVQFKEEHLHFSDRIVILAFGTIEQIEKLQNVLNAFTELRRAKDNPDFFLDLPKNEQMEWIDEALERIRPAKEDKVSICILDTGVTLGHPLINPHLEEEDLQSYRYNWPKYDQKNGHGTQMAGLALYGDIVNLLSDNKIYAIPFRLESVRIIPPKNDNDPELYGAITSACVSRAEIVAPKRKRIIIMAVTSPDYRDRGQPSSWSAAIDKICSGAEDDERRIIIISAGNTNLESRKTYPQNNETEGIHDPAQAWNALCVGAFTEKTYIDHEVYPDWTPIAPVGDLSPASTTSLIWDKQWPLKPDVVFEGGNDSLLPNDIVDNGPDSLGLLTTHHQTYSQMFTICKDTSAATAQVARMAAFIQAEYKEFWPETIRALLIHSARWTTAMKKRWASDLKNRKGKAKLIRYCGFGVPNINRALKSAKNELTFIIQDRLQPFKIKKNKCKYKEMNIHKIPWPNEVLIDMFDLPVTMRVTLSYFIEPNPARRGWSNKYRYASHQLKFEVKTPTEDLSQFRKRINKAARDEEKGHKSQSDSKQWDLGPDLRHKGSIHSDSWNGTAIELAERAYIAVYPSTGWWKERINMERWDRLARYSLIISIESPESDIDLYTEIVNKIKIEVSVS